MVNNNLSDCSSVQNMHLFQICKEINPFLTMFRMLGLLPLTIIREKNRITLQLSSKDWLYVLFYVLAYLLPMLYNLKEILNETAFNLIFMFRLIYFTTYALLTFVFLIAMYNHRRAYTECLKKLAKIDSLCTSIAVKVRSNSNSRYLQLFVGSLFIVYFKLILVMFLPFATYMQVLVLIFVPLVRYLVVFQFIIIIKLSLVRYERIKAEFESFENETTYLDEPDLLLKKIKILMACFHEVCSTNKLLMSIFGGRIFVIAIGTILSVFIELTSFYFLFTKTVVLEHKVKLLVLSLWSLEDIVPSCTILKFCSNTCKKVKVHKNGPISLVKKFVNNLKM